MDLGDSRLPDSHLHKVVVETEVVMFQYPPPHHPHPHLQHWCYQCPTSVLHSWTCTNCMLCMCMCMCVCVRVYVCVVHVCVCVCVCGVCVVWCVVWCVCGVRVVCVCVPAYLTTFSWFIWDNSSTSRVMRFIILLLLRMRMRLMAYNRPSRWLRT